MPPENEGNLGGIGGMWAVAGPQFDTSGFKEWISWADKASKATSQFLKPWGELDQKVIPKVEKFYKTILSGLKNVQAESKRTPTMPGMPGQLQLGLTTPSVPVGTQNLWQKASAATQGFVSQFRQYVSGVPLGSQVYGQQNLFQGGYAGQPNIWQRASSATQLAVQRIRAAQQAISITPENVGQFMRGGGLTGAIEATGVGYGLSYLTRQTMPIETAGAQLARATPGRYNPAMARQYQSRLAGMYGNDLTDVSNAALILQNARGMTPNQPAYWSAVQNASLLSQLSGGMIGAGQGAQAISAMWQPQVFNNLQQRLGISTGRLQGGNIADTWFQILQKNATTGRNPGGFSAMTPQARMEMVNSATVQGSNFNNFLSQYLGLDPDTIASFKPLLQVLAQYGKSVDLQNKQVQQQLGIGKTEAERIQQLNIQYDKAKQKMGEELLPIVETATKDFGGFISVLNKVPGLEKGIVDLGIAFGVLKVATLAAAAAERVLAATKGAGAAGAAGSAAEAGAAGAGAEGAGGLGSFIAPVVGTLGAVATANSIAGAIDKTKSVRRVGRSKVFGVNLPPPGRAFVDVATMGGAESVRAVGNLIGIGDPPPPKFIPVLPAKKYVGDPISDAQKVIHGPGHLQGMQSSILTKLEQMFHDNPNLVLNSGYRSSAEQARLYQLYKAGKGNLAAPPGHSMHEKGLAADIGPPNQWGWLAANVGKYGLVRVVNGEPWHVEPSGARASSGAPPAATGTATTSTADAGTGNTGSTNAPIWFDPTAFGASSTASGRIVSAQGLIDQLMAGTQNQQGQPQAGQQTGQAPATAPQGSSATNQSQRDIEKTIVDVWRQMGASPRVLLAAFETGFVESGMQNINYGDRDSLGVFQQRPSQGWGSPSQVMNPAYAAGKFISAAMGYNKPGTAGQMAQAVQRSAFPARYDQRRGQAVSAIASFGVDVSHIGDPSSFGTRPGKSSFMAVSAPSQSITIHNVNVVLNAQGSSKQEAANLVQEMFRQIDSETQRHRISERISTL